ncbi:MAG: GNAT family N-acetyltransferase [Corallococcus sp.]|nr:GNAT family N-acetyltransferase [Corallococcus sp.]
MMIKIIQSDDLDANKLMAIYAEGNLENTDYFYPEIADKVEAVTKVEHDFCNYIKTEFLNGTNCYYVWEKDGNWVSALRLNYIKDNFYYLEALETSPNFRKKGYATKLLSSVINELKSKGHFKICVCVGKNNTASLNTHKKCGFEIVNENGYDYLQKEIDNRCYGLEYSF